MTNLKNDMGLTASQDLISIIVPAYRVEKYLDDCISSIVRQTYSNLEIVLVDDGSDDSCSFVCDKWAGKDNRVLVIHKHNGGLSDARNVGLGIIHGKYIAFVDSDDWIDNTYIEKLMSAAYNERADVVTCAMANEFEKTGETVFENREFFSGNSEQALAMLYDQTRIRLDACKLYKQYIWNDLRFPYGKLYEDLLSVYKVFDLAGRIVQIPEALYHYRIRDNSIMTAAFSLKIVGISDAWKENYLFCEEKYPSVAPLAHMFWLEIIPGILRKFPKELNEDEKAAKHKLKKEISDNLSFIIRYMPAKKVFYLIKAMMFL